MPPEPKPWYESRTLLSVILFLALLASYVGLRVAGVDVPGWLPEGGAALFAVLVGWLRMGTDRPVGKP